METNCKSCRILETKYGQVIAVPSDTGLWHIVPVLFPVAMDDKSIYNGDVITIAHELALRQLGRSIAEEHLMKLDKQTNPYAGGKL